MTNFKLFLLAVSATVLIASCGCRPQQQQR